jgi:hypothetical protein
MTVTPPFTPQYVPCLIICFVARLRLPDQGVLRIQTDIRIGTRIDRPAQGFEHKVKCVKEILAGDQA